MNDSYSTYCDMNILELLDRPIAFQRSFVNFCNSITTALFLSQLVYWAHRTNDPEGWFWKTQEEWKEETGLSRYEQESARAKLRKLKILEEKKKAVAPTWRQTLFFRINQNRLIELLSHSSSSNCCFPASKDGEKQQPKMLETSSQGCCKLAALNKESEITSETTSEITKEREQDSLSVSTTISENIHEPISENQVNNLTLEFVRDLTAEYDEYFEVYRQRGLDIDASRIGLVLAIRENPAKYMNIKDRRLYVRKWLHNERARFPGFNAEAMRAAHI